MRLNRPINELKLELEAINESLKCLAEYKQTRDVKQKIRYVSQEAQEYREAIQILESHSCS